VNKVAMEKEMSKVVAACEERLNALKAEHTQQIQQSKKKNLDHLFVSSFNFIQDFVENTNQVVSINILQNVSS
jgi:phosphoglucomutase